MGNTIKVLGTLKSSKAVDAKKALFPFQAVSVDRKWCGGVDVK